MAAMYANDLGKYRLIAELGRGGMAEVFLALASGPAGFNKLVVIKCMREHLAEEAEFIGMFLAEARLAARLNHPNVVQTNEVGYEGAQLFIAMEHLEGQALNRVVSRLGREGALTTAMHVRILIDALEGLHYAHELCDFDGTPLGVVHRDMTPHNVFVCYSGQIKVVDFGIAKAFGTAHADTPADVLKGKVAYMAPEQALGERLDRRADIFSVGVMLWEALAGRRLFCGETDLTMLQKIIRGDIPRPREARPDVPPRLEAICMKALATDREKRHATAAELRADLEEALEAMGERPMLRDIGRLLGEHFEAERAKIKALVEAQMSAFKTGSAPPPSHALTRLHPISSERPRARIADASTPPPDSRRASEEAVTQSQRPTAPVIELMPRSATQRSKTYVTQPSTALLRPPWMTLWLSAAAATSITAATFAWVHGRAEAPPPLSPPPPASSGPPLSPPPPVSSGSSALPARTLSIESSPPGARVTEAGHVLGKTPLTLAIDPAWAAARRFEIALEEYAPYIVQQGPTHEDVRILVRLAQATAPARASGSACAGAAAAHAKAAPGPAARPSLHAPVGAKKPRQGKPTQSITMAR